jgi:asparagine synthase (glutamine-hydrolysing)
MSGIVGLVHLGGAPADPQLIRRLTQSLSFRGPDAQEVWVGDSAALGHALLRTSAERERQPLCLDGRVWITADARLDDRATLVRELAAVDPAAALAAPDAELILRAYLAWGPECPRHLLGDFSFAVWDARGRTLFCARDHFGVKPFYYARLENTFLVGNTQQSLLAHPHLPGRLDEQAVADFLMFGMDMDLGATYFAAIRRLPPAHTLTLRGSQLEVSRYWQLPADGRIRYRREGDYVAHFLDLLDRATEDRLYSPRTGVLMSGGLDSPAVAASACRVARRGGGAEVRAYTTVYDRLIPHDERRYASRVAESLGIPIHVLSVDDYPLFEPGGAPACGLPDPAHVVGRASTAEVLRAVSADTRVVLTGEGGDPNLFPPRTYLWEMLRGPRALGVLWHALRYAWTYRRLPRFGFRTHLQQLRAAAEPVPAWLDRDLAGRLDLARRAESLVFRPDPSHPLRPEAFRILTKAYWPFLFEGFDPGSTGFALEFRHPLFDRRVVEYCLAIPPVPWCLDKELLRAAMRGVLPEEVWKRPKAPLRLDPVLERLRAGDAARLDDSLDHPQLAAFVHQEAVPRFKSGDDGFDAASYHVHLRPIALNYWLKCALPVGYKPRDAGISSPEGSSPSTLATRT